jgi:CheY-like chemotaxis protein
VKPILVAVGVAQSRRRLVEILIDAGYKVLEADSGERALSLAHTTPPKLILVSIVMPGITGLEFAAKLQQSLAARTPPMIVMGTIPPIGLNDEPLASLVNGYLNLDVSPVDLLTTVQSQLVMAGQ